jgi:hypothetical protein
MTAWLRHYAGRSGREAAVCTRTARRLRQLRVTAAAYGDGTLSGGQVQAIVANLNDKTAGLFAEHEPELVPTISGLFVTETATAMQDWARKAEALLGDDKDTPQPERSLHLSRILDGRRELRGSFEPEAGAVIETALRLAQTRDLDGESARAPPDAAPTPWSMCAAGSSTTRPTTPVAATGRTSTSSPPWKTSRTVARGGS